VVQPRQALQTKKCRRGPTRRAPTATVATVVEKNTGGESLEPRANDKGCARLWIEVGYTGTIQALDPTSVAAQAQKTRGATTALSHFSNISTTESVPEIARAACAGGAQCCEATEICLVHRVRS
jgi:hypothetical protein